MSLEGLYLYEIGQLADKLTKEFSSLSYEEFAEDEEKIESAVVRLAIMREGWTWLPIDVRQELVQINWQAIAGKWNWQAHRHLGVDSRELWETLVLRLPQMGREVEELMATKSERRCYAVNNSEAD